MVRWQVAATLRSWVTISTVEPSCSWRSLHQPQNVQPRLRVQIARRLVGQQDRREHGQRARNRHALTLTAGQLIGKMVDTLAKLHQLQQLARARLDLLSRPAAQVQRQRHVFQARQAGEKIEELENESDLVAPHGSQAIVREAIQALAVERDVAGCWPVEARL